MESMQIKDRIKLHKVLKSVGIVTLVLLVGAWYLGLTTARHMKQIIRDQFNEQQLILARAAAFGIEANLQNALADLILLNSLPAIQYADSESYEILLLSTLPVLNRDNIIEIRRGPGWEHPVCGERSGHRHGPHRPAQQEAGVYLSWASALSNRGKNA
jgi:hypothetical protein